jgi:hypothetical protein
VSGFTEAEWAALAAAVRADEEQRAAAPFLCDELFDPDDLPPDPPRRKVRNCITDLANYQPSP